MLSPKCLYPKMSIAITHAATSITIWINDKWLIVKLTGFGLCSRRNIKEKEKSSTTLAMIPMLTSKKNRYCMSRNLKDLLCFLPSMEKEGYRRWLKRKAQKFVVDISTFINLSRRYFLKKNCVDSFCCGVFPLLLWISWPFSLIPHKYIPCSSFYQSQLEYESDCCDGIVIIALAYLHSIFIYLRHFQFLMISSLSYLALYLHSQIQ